VEVAAAAMNGLLRAVCLAVFVAVWSVVAAGQAVVDAAETGLPPGLTAPTSPVYADGAWYDIVAVRWTNHDTLRLEIEMGSIDPAGVGEIGMRQPIVEVYVDEGRGGATDLLPGSGLRMPAGTGWSQALRLSGDGAWWWQVAADGERLAPPRALPVEVEGRVARVTWPTAVAADARLYAISGVYDPFAADGWRRFGDAPSPWAFAAEEPGPPVVDLLPGDAAAWQQMRSSGELPRTVAAREAGPLDGGWLWWTLMALGMSMAIAGVVWRARYPTALPASRSTGDGPSPSVALEPAEEATGPAEETAGPAEETAGPAEETAGPAASGNADFDAPLIGDDEVGSEVPAPPAPIASPATEADVVAEAAPSGEGGPLEKARAPDQLSREAGGATEGSGTVVLTPSAEGAGDDGETPATPPAAGASAVEPAPDAANSTRATDAPTASSRSAKRS
jgi:hypothetical protein